MNTNEKLIELQKKWSNSYKDSLEKVLVELTEKLHQEFVNDRHKKRAEIVAQYRIREEEMKVKIFKESNDLMEQQIQEVQRTHREELNRVKRRQWCRVCAKEACYPCCWNTTYCSLECQRMDWQAHREVCRHKKNAQAAPGEDYEELKWVSPSSSGYAAEELQLTKAIMNRSYTGPHMNRSLGTPQRHLPQPHLQYQQHGYYPMFFQPHPSPAAGHMISYASPGTPIRGRIIKTSARPRGTPQQPYGARSSISYATHHRGRGRSMQNQGRFVDQREIRVPVRVSSMPSSGNTTLQYPSPAPLQLGPANLGAARKQAPLVEPGFPTGVNNAYADDEDDVGHAETYAEYVPSKLCSGLQHPDCVVETSTLSSVQPPDVKYQISIPEELIDTGCISALQLEAVIYACQMHQNCLPSGERCGYLIGDGAGVGKGRTIACIIYENFLLGRKRAIWLSVSSDLRYDSERDFRDIGATGINVYQLNKLKYAKISGKENGEIKKGVMFATYSSLIGECRTAKAKYRSRLKQLVQWCGGPDFDGVIVFDECHRAKNLCPSAGSKPTKTGRMVLELQKELPNARVVYASATGASEPRNMAYMTRLGLWGSGQSFPEFGDFINAVERRGVGAMEVVAMDMKQRGMYLARQLSFRGVSFRVQEVPLSDEFIRVYDDSVKLWLECRRQFQNALDQMSEDRRSAHKMIWGQFWAAHQRFFKYLCIAAKVEACVRITRESIKQNKCVVIGLQSTGEARTLEQLEDCGGELTEFVSTAKAVLQGLIEKHFPTGSGRCGAGDALDDMGRMFGCFGEGENRKRRRNELLEDFEISPQAKRRQDEDDSDEYEEEINDSDTTDGDGSDEDISIGDDDEAWINTLMQEAESSSSEDYDEEEDDSSESEEEFNPFTFDFENADPYSYRRAHPELLGKTAKEIAEIKKTRREERERRRKEFRKELRRKKQNAAISGALKRKNAIESEAMKFSADAFIKSSRIIDNDFSDGFASATDLSTVKTKLLAAIEKLGKSLPANTLDHLIDELGGPQFVAELTGRKGRVVTKPDGEVCYELRSANVDVALEKMNLEEKDLFMKGAKKIAIISEAASSGISLQSDRRAQNQLRRVHITLELPWSADKAIQQFGRTHRSNQVSAPEYLFLISELAGEKRFASIVAKRLESLGALTHGDRRATETRDLSQFNLDTKYGRSALDVLCRSIIGSLNPPLIEPPADYMPGNFFQDMRHYMEGVGLLNRVDKDVYSVEREAANISKFLNRILGLPVHAQNALFQYFLDVLKALVEQARCDGTYDLGIMDLGTGSDVVRKMETRVFVGHAQKGSFRVEMHKVVVERGVSWEQAMELYKDHNSEEDGFYISKKGPAGKRSAALIYGIGKLGMEKGVRMYALTRPSTGRSAKLEPIADIKKRFQKTPPEEAEQVWKDQYENAASSCQHIFVHGKCKTASQGQYCEVGRRTRTYFILSGAVLSVWPIVEEVLCGGNIRDSTRKSARMQVIRVRTEENQKIVGRTARDRNTPTCTGRSPGGTLQQKLP
ncbi:hypothetical protein QR680_004360 [Steinernema hermaphroditum]|uniref:MYND-type domain-containing protein n=1 Tax=Steinernema hermaphroditum TaxID=289476 RepID=A0AA39HPV8_9BILA|nr:hypothetical protein QR680_004360 [Steinernema hermaphroditum]